MMIIIPRVLHHSTKRRDSGAARRAATTAAAGPTTASTAAATAAVGANARHLALLPLLRTLCARLGTAGGAVGVRADAAIVLLAVQVVHPRRAVRLLADACLLL